MTSVGWLEQILLRLLTDECGVPEDLARDDALFRSNPPNALDIVSRLACIEEGLDVCIPALDMGRDKMGTVALIVTSIDQFQKS